ncbi:hydroxyethylthiazole kinase [Tropicimonas isoalkanivorans]|uniref:Hydroxyethylthiazole kinase n=1 Tax=Tropicimonas isoalkanivorans TaxID=441112 RepID=A0A1I1FTL8_9RHOB|nr:hydroxyethylthiazole kinase [Tropicimonas isoalkanivorans]SFC02641.1 hydroxyethylthiazole kinase [Tropicimonas isoalkanivorans]
MTAPSQSLASMREAAPLVQCITNYVAMNFAANTLLAAGAAPAMVHDVEEAGEFAAIAGALTINIGTLSPRWVAGMIEASSVAAKTGKPWVLDPVACFATGLRREATSRLMQKSPTIVRGNASEILAIGGQDSSGKGVDAGDSVTAAEAAARDVAQRAGSVVAVTGEVDFVTDGSRAVRISGGSPLMPKVTASGCALTCLVGAYAAAVEDPFDATVGALAHFAAAGAEAAKVAQGPGSFLPAFLDAVAAVTPETIGDDRVQAA